MDNDDSEGKNDILNYEKCVYTVVEDGPDYENVMEETFKKSKEWIYVNKYKHKGIAILNMLLIEHHKGTAKSYLELYIPIV